MKIRRITIITKQWLAAILITVLLPWGAAVWAAVSTDEPFVQAAERGELALVKSMLEKGVDVNARNKYGQTALILAAARGHFDVVKLLLEKGADLRARDH